MKLSRLKVHPLRWLKRWLVKKERSQVQTFESGVKNVDSVFAAIAIAATHAVHDAAGLLWSGATWPFWAAKRGLVKISHELVAVIRQLASDSGKLARRVGHGLLWPVKQTWKPLAKVGSVVVAPVRRPFAARAKEQALSEVTMTPDRHAHRELLALLAGAAVVVGICSMLLTGSTRTVTGVLPSVNLSPAVVLSKLAGASPSALALVAAAGLIAIALVWFWVKMVADVWRRSFATHTEQTQWRLVTTFLFVPGALVYFFKVYNRWSFRQFLTYHMISVLVAGVAVLVATSTYGTLWYFNKQAQAEVSVPGSQVPNLEVSGRDESALDRPKYGAPLTASGDAGRVDPFAPIPGEAPPASPVPSPSPQP